MVTINDEIASKAVIVSFINQKGGVCKTTLAIIFSILLKKLGKRVGYCDADPQKTGTKHFQRAWDNGIDPKDMPTLIRGDGDPRIGKELRQTHANHYDYILADGPGKLDLEYTKITKQLIRYSDVALVPCVPSIYDIEDTKPVIDLIHEHHEIEETTKPNTAIVVTRKKDDSILGKAIYGMMDDWQFPLFENALSHAEVYNQISVDGSTIVDLFGKRKFAKIENNVLSLFREFCEMLGGDLVDSLDTYCKKNSFGKVKGKK